MITSKSRKENGKMRLELGFSLKYPRLPVDNKRIWFSFLKSCLAKSGDGRFYKRYYE